MFRTHKAKTNKDIASEWDALAPIRYRQITSGEDISYTHVILPTMIELVKQTRPRTILDAGCGVGVFTKSLGEIAEQVLGIDPSHESIKIARVVAPKIQFVNSTLEDFAATNDLRFELITANMTLMDTVSLGEFLKACVKLLTDRGHLIFSITHPWFWPEYYGYANQSWFKYESEIIIEGAFRISSEPSGKLVSTHIHRPLSRYVDELHAAGVVVSRLLEPNPPAGLGSEYEKRWTKPRYLFAVAQRADKSALPKSKT